MLRKSIGGFLFPVLLWLVWMANNPAKSEQVGTNWDGEIRTGGKDMMPLQRACEGEDEVRIVSHYYVLTG
jgi:hypothetical protein